MDVALRFRHYRAFSSFCAAVVAVEICRFQGHVHVDVARPETYGSPFQHRCGLLTVACLGWAMVECAQMARDRRAWVFWGT